ncbi:MAG: ABC transporter permease [Bryobacteraceae bacterium]
MPGLFVQTLFNDLRYGFRQLKRAPVLSAVAVLSLALGIGANTAIFTLIDAVLMQNLPVKDPAKLVLFYDGISTGVYSGDGFPGDMFSYAAWEYFRDHNQPFESVSAFCQGNNRVLVHLVGSAGSGPKEQASSHLVSGNYFNVFGLQASAGRLLTPEDDALNAPSVAVISYNYWDRRFHLDHAVIGKAVELNGAVFTIVGIAPREFFGERVQTAPDFWLPLTRQPQVMQDESLLSKRDHFWLNMIGRLRPGVTMQAAQATLDTQLHQFYTAQVGSRISPEQQRKIHNVNIALKPGGRGISWMRFRYSQPLHILMTIVSLVLLIACANLAALLLARASARHQEFCARLALGASRSRLVRQLLTESVLLSVFGGAAGVAFAWWGVKALVAMVGVSSVVKVRPDFLVLSFTFAISILTGIGFGLVPALRAGGLERNLGSSVRSAQSGRSRFNPAHAFLIVQIALSSVLLVGAGLLTHSLVNLEYQDLGFNRENVLSVRTDPRLAGYQPAELPALYQKLHERLNALPGVLSASIARYSPLSGSESAENFSIEGYTPAAGKEMKLYDVEVGPKFFETLQIPLLLGRVIGPRDTPASPLVAVISEALARQYFPNQNPIGRHIYLGAPFKPPGAEIVGVVADSKYYDATEKPKPMAYFAVGQPIGPDPYSGELLIRTAGNPSGAAAEIRNAVHEIDSRLPIEKVTTLGKQVDDSFRPAKNLTTFCGFFGLLALLLASIGLYGTMAYAVARRTNEIGIRMALGAERGNVLWMVLRESAAFVLLGLLLGAPLAMAGARWLKSFLFDLPTVDMTGISAAIVLLVAASAIAAYLPARRATRVDPMVALRYE